MNIDQIEQELSVMQLSDSFFPTGIFATSNGLEFLFKEEKIRGMTDLLELIEIIMIQQIGPTDCVALANVFDSIDENNFEKIIDIDRIVYSTKPIKEIREASTRSGLQLIKCVSEFIKDNKFLEHYKTGIAKNTVKGIFPVAFAICCSSLKINKEKSMSMMLYGITVSIVGAALRLGLIQHFEGQKIIHSIKPTISQITQKNSNKKISEIWQFAPQIDVVQMSHEKMDSKMFIT